MKKTLKKTAAQEEIKAVMSAGSESREKNVPMSGGPEGRQGTRLSPVQVSPVRALYHRLH